MQSPSPSSARPDLVRHTHPWLRRPLAGHCVEGRASRGPRHRQRRPHLAPRRGPLFPASADPTERFRPGRPVRRSGVRGWARVPLLGTHASCNHSDTESMARVEAQLRRGRAHRLAVAGPGPPPLLCKRRKWVRHQPSGPNAIRTTSRRGEDGSKARRASPRRASTCQRAEQCRGRAAYTAHRPSVRPKWRDQSPDERQESRASRPPRAQTSKRNERRGVDPPLHGRRPQAAGMR